MFDQYGYYVERSNKTPLDREIIAKMLKKGSGWGILLLFLVALLLVGMGLLAQLSRHLLVDIFAWLCYGAAAVMVLEMIIPLILLPMGKFTVSLDAMCRKEIVHRGSGRHTDIDYMLYFSHHGSCTTTHSLYHYSEPGQMFYVVSFYGKKWAPTMVFHTHMYEWVGAPEDLGGVRPEADVPAVDTGVENTILARRPLSKGRKTRLTDEEIIRDLLEERRVLDELLIKLSVGLLALCGVLFFVNISVATTASAVVGAVCAVLLVQRWIGKRRIQKHRFIITSDTLMDKDPITRGVWRWKKMRFVLAFRNSGSYRLPRQDGSVYYDAELGDTFFVIRLEGKSKKIRAVYSRLDYDWD